MLCVDWRSSGDLSARSLRHNGAGKDQNNEVLPNFLTAMSFLQKYIINNTNLEERKGTKQYYPPIAPPEYVSITILVYKPEIIAVSSCVDPSSVNMRISGAVRTITKSLHRRRHERKNGCASIAKSRLRRLRRALTSYSRCNLVVSQGLSRVFS